MKKLVGVCQKGEAGTEGQIINAETKKRISDAGNWVFFSGELYDQTELKEKTGYTGDETIEELLSAYYRKYGVDRLVRILNGKFIIAIWNDAERTMTLIRDHLGIKPLYYYQANDEELLFSDRLTNLLRYGIPARLSYEGLGGYLNYGSVQEPYTIIKDVWMLPPGSYGTFSEKNGLQIKGYWDPIDSFGDYAKRQDISDTFAAAAEKSKRMAFDAMRLQTGSQKKQCFLLSGGIDSTAVVAMQRQLQPEEPIDTFVVTHENPKYDEWQFARLAAEKNKTRHTELEISADYIREHFEEAIGDLDQPSVDGTNTWCASKRLKDAGYEIFLSGIGGDELFVGEDFESPRKLKKLYGMTRFLPRSMGYAIDRLAKGRTLKRMAKLLECRRDPYFVSRKMLTDEQAKNLIRPDIYKKNKDEFQNWEHLAFDAVYENGKKLPEYISRIQYYEERTYLLSTELRDTVQMSEAHGLSVRFPLLDYRLVEYMTALSVASKADFVTPKVHLVRMAGEGMPKECVERKKGGFTLPYEDYLRTGLKEEMEKFFLNGGDVSYYDKTSIRKMWIDYIEKGQGNHVVILAVYILDKWLKYWKVKIE